MFACSNTATLGVAAAVRSSTLSPSSSPLKSQSHQHYCKKNQPRKKPTDRIGNFLSRRLLLVSSSSKQIASDDELFMVQKSIESRNQRTRRGCGATSNSDVQDFPRETSLRYRQVTRFTTTNSAESSDSDLIDVVQVDGKKGFCEVTTCLSVGICSIMYHLFYSPVAIRDPTYRTDRHGPAQPGR